MKTAFARALLLTLLVFPCASQAMSGKGTVCTNNKNATEAAICFQAAMKSAESKLAGKLQEVSKSLRTTTQRKALAHTQTLWKQYVQETCFDLVKPASAEEPIGYVDVLSCKVELTLERTRDLDRIFYVTLHD